MNDVYCVTSGCPYKLCSRVFQSRVFHPCKTGPPFSSPAISTPAIWSRVFQSRVFSVPISVLSHCRVHTSACSSWRIDTRHCWYSVHRVRTPDSDDCRRSKDLALFSTQHVQQLYATPVLAALKRLYIALISPQTISFC